MPRPKAFITGILGFAGSYLAEELLAHGYEVVGNRYDREPLDNIAAVRKQVELVPLDILNADRCRAVFAHYRPDYIFHLAAMASVGKSFSREKLTFEINVSGTLNVLAAAGQVKRLKKFVMVGSADCYGRFSPKGKTLTESQPLNPISPYGISKAAAEQAALYYLKRYELPVTVARPFNHSGPRQIDSFVIPAFARQIALIEAGRHKPVMSVGNLSARRDLSDVRDIVRGYRLLAEHGRTGEVYHLSRGKTVAIEGVLRELMKLAGRKITVKTDRTRLRAAEIPVLRGDNTKARRELGFKIEYSLSDTVSDTLNYWREKVRR